MAHCVEAGCPRAFHWAPSQCVFLWPKARPGRCFWRPCFHARVAALALCAETLAWSMRSSTPSSRSIQSPSQVWRRKARLHSSNGYLFLLSLLQDPGKGLRSLANDLSFLRAQNAQETPSHQPGCFSGSMAVARAPPPSESQSPAQRHIH